MKNDIESNWITAGNNGFIPMQGELIIYAADDEHLFPRLKVGDGKTNVTLLPFIDAGTINGYSLIGPNLMFYPKARNFPRSGSDDKLYIALDKNTIYYFQSGVGYIQLSNFTYTADKQKIETIKANSWSAGTMTNADVRNNRLIIENGQEPSLELEDIFVITNISKNDAEIVVPEGDD